MGIDKIRRHQMLMCGPCTEGDRFLLCDPRSTLKVLVRALRSMDGGVGVGRRARHVRDGNRVFRGDGFCSVVDSLY